MDKFVFSLIGLIISLIEFIFGFYSSSKYLKCYKSSMNSIHFYHLASVLTLNILINFFMIYIFAYFIKANISYKQLLGNKISNTLISLIIIILLTIIFHFKLIYKCNCSVYLYFLMCLSTWIILLILGNFENIKKVVDHLNQQNKFNQNMMNQNLIYK